MTELMSVHLLFGRQKLFSLPFLLLLTLNSNTLGAVVKDANILDVHFIAFLHSFAELHIFQKLNPEKNDYHLC